jgi:hypothetical protein
MGSIRSMVIRNVRLRLCVEEHMIVEYKSSEMYGQRRFRLITSETIILAGKSVMNIKYMFELPLQRLFGIYKYI